MSFFPPRPDPPPDPLAGVRPGPWLPGVVPQSFLLARSDQAAMALTNLGAYPDRFAFTLSLHLHPSMPVDESRWPLDADAALGIAWPDGGVATWGRLGAAHGRDAAHAIMGGSGGGDGFSRESHLWAYPLPAEGELRFVVEWPPFGIPETSTSVDVALFAEAASRARPIWPEDAGKRTFLTIEEVRRAFQEFEG